jgi:DNA-directed RNA polymerase subunit omega
MARITVEDCLKKIDSQYDLVLLAKERTIQLNAGTKSLVPEDNDKNTVISLREIAEGKISIKTLEESGINRLRLQKEDSIESENEEDEQDDDFDKIYKGEVSKSGAAILPSKRVRRIPEKVSLEPSKESEEIEVEKTAEVLDENTNEKTPEKAEAE